MDYEKKNKDAISTIKQALRQLATNGVPVGNMIKAMKDIEEKYAESEDERIRKEMIFYFQEEIPQCSIQEHADKMKKFIAWLEKQGEHAKFRDSIQVGDKVTRNKDGVLVNLSQLKRVAKPADKVEPKFKAGDCIKPIDSCLGSQRTICEVCDGWYVTNQGTLDFEYENNWELVEQKPDDKVEPKFHEGDWVTIKE